MQGLDGPNTGGWMFLQPLRRCLAGCSRYSLSLEGRKLGVERRSIEKGIPDVLCWPDEVDWTPDAVAVYEVVSYWW